VAWLLLFALLAVAGADEASEDDVEASGDSDSSEIGASEHVSTVTLFPDFPDQKFTQGQFVDVLCGFSNNGDKSFNITTLKGSLNSPMDYQYIQNFSDLTPFSEIKEGDQGTLYYRFFPDPQLEPREYMLTLTVDYIDADKEEFQTVYFNQTVELIESQSAQDSPPGSAGVWLSSCLLDWPSEASSSPSALPARRARRPPPPRPKPPAARTSGCRIPCLLVGLVAPGKRARRLEANRVRRCGAVIGCARNQCWRQSALSVRAKQCQAQLCAKRQHRRPCAQLGTESKCR